MNFEEENCPYSTFKSELEENGRDDYCFFVLCRALKKKSILIFSLMMD